MYSMSNVVFSGLLLAFNLLGMMALMMSSKRHRDKFHHDEQKRYITKQLWLRWLWLLLLLIGSIFSLFVPYTGYFIVVWFPSLIVATGIIYLSMVVYGKLA